jgi:site-specific DNA-methyltransferase (adenine-specific)
MELNKVYNEDCRITMKRIKDKSVNLIIADFPYFEVKGEFDFIWKDFNEFLEWVEVCAKEFKRILSDNGSLYVYGDAKKIAYKQIIFDKYFNLENNLVWYKPDCMAKKGIGEFRSFAPSTERILFYSNEIVSIEGICVNNIREYIRSEILRAKGKIVFKDINQAIGTATNGGGVASATLSLEKAEPTMMTKEHYNKLKNWLNDNQDYEYLKKDYEYLKKDYEYLKKDYDDLRRPFNNTKYEDVLSFNQDIHLYNKYNHPTLKPPKLSAELIKISSRENDLVYIPFGGSGTELEQCHLLNRKYIGSELELKYCEIIEDRIKHAKGEVGLFSNEIIQGSLF